MKDSLKLRFLTEDEVDRIYEKSLSILSEKGVKVEYAKALKIMLVSQRILGLEQRRLYLFY